MTSARKRARVCSAVASLSMSEGFMRTPNSVVISLSSGMAVCRSWTLRKHGPSLSFDACQKRCRSARESRS